MFRVAAAVLAVVVMSLPRAQARPSGSALTVSGRFMQIDGRPAFLVGVSLFDALGSAAPRDADLDALKRWGVNAVRVWAHWHEPIYQADGALTAQGRTRLVTLTERLRGRGIILELVLLRPGQLPQQPFAVFASESARVNAVEAIAGALRPFRNALFDLYNEHDHPDGPISHAAARALRDRVKAIDPERVVTMSSTGSHIVSPAGAVDERGAANLRGEVGTEAGSAALDLVAPHFPRTDDWASVTGARVVAVRAALNRIGTRVPIYLDEERRADPSARIAPAAYRRARADAQRAGAAGWVFHTAAGFELRTAAFVDALSADERAALQSLRAR